MTATLLRQQGIDNTITQYGMARQAIINGNFDVWQRGTTSATIADSTAVFLADRWFDTYVQDGGTLPTLTRTRQILTSGDISNAFYYSRLTTNGAGTSLGINSRGGYFHRIENGVRNLCGLNKKVTVSFWARSSITNKRIGIFLLQNSGTGGSPSTSETINGTNWTLTSTWTKYTHTFTTNTLVGKTFGTANDDYLSLSSYYIWGTNGYDDFVGATTAETFIGSGTIDIAQVQLCAGDVALPFMPKSYATELADCMRYFQRLGGQAPYNILLHGQCISTTGANYLVKYLVKMRTVPTITYTGTFQTTQANGTGGAATLANNQVYDDAAFITGTSTLLVAGNATFLFTNNSTSYYIDFSSEL